MSDQRGQDAGNLWVWPGTHLAHAEYFRENGPEAFFAAGGYPPIRLPEPEQVTGGAGDLLLAHYEHTYTAPGDRFPRPAPTADPADRDISASPHAVPGAMAQNPLELCPLYRHGLPASSDPVACWHAAGMFVLLR